MAIAERRLIPELRRSLKELRAISPCHFRAEQACIGLHHRIVIEQRHSGPSITNIRLRVFAAGAVLKCHLGRQAVAWKSQMFAAFFRQENIAGRSYDSAIGSTVPRRRKIGGR